MLSYPPLTQHVHVHTDIQTDGDYTKRVVTTLRDRTLKKLLTLLLSLSHFIRRAQEKSFLATNAGCNEILMRQINTFISGFKAPLRRRRHATAGPFFVCDKPSELRLMGEITDKNLSVPGTKHTICLNCVLFSTTKLTATKCVPHSPVTAFHEEPR